MKKSLLLILAVICHINYLTAQISIVSSDMPAANDTLRYSVANNINDFQKGGANQNWNFSNLNPQYQDVEKYYPPFQTPYGFYFSQASYGLPENVNLGPAGAGLASNIYGFYRNSNAAFISMGKGATVQSLPLGISYNPRDTMFTYPLTYEKVFEGSYMGSAGFPGLGTLVQTGYRRTVVDGWGNVTTPYGTFECLRVKSVVEGQDSINFNGFGLGFPNTTTTYFWLAKNQKFPIVEVVINGLTQAITVRYKDVYRPELYLRNARFSANRTVASTKDTITLLNQSLGKPQSYKWSITPSGFRYVAGTNSSSESPRLLFDMPGKYSIKLEVSYLGGFDDTLRNNYITIETAIGLNQADINEAITLYPNPCEKEAFLFNGSNQNARVMVWDAGGKRVQELILQAGTKEQLNFETYAPGIYIVQIALRDGVLVKKLVVN